MIPHAQLVSILKKESIVQHVLQDIHAQGGLRNIPESAPKDFIHITGNLLARFAQPGIPAQIRVCLQHLAIVINSQ